MQGMSRNFPFSQITLFPNLVSNVLNNLSNPKPGHTTGGSSRGARRGGGAGPDRAGRRQNTSPRRHASLVPYKASKTRVLNALPEARTSEIPCKPMEEHNGRLNGLNAIKPMGEHNGRLNAIKPMEEHNGLTAGRGTLFVPGSRQVDRRLFVSV